MNNVSRRMLLSTAAVLPLAACTGGISAIIDKGLTIADKVPEIIENAKAISGALVKILPALTSVVGTGTAVAAKVVSAIRMVQDGAESVQSGGASMIANGITLLQAAMTGFELPPWASTVVKAAAAALPLIGVNIPMAGDTGGMNPRQALVILKTAREGFSSIIGVYSSV